LKYLRVTTKGWKKKIFNLYFSGWPVIWIFSSSCWCSKYSYLIYNFSLSKHSVSIHGWKISKNQKIGWVLITRGLENFKMEKVGFPKKCFTNNCKYI